MTELRRSFRVPHHVLVLLGLSSGAYAALLAAITGLQSGADAATARARGPAAVAASALAEGHARLERSVSEAEAAHVEAAAAYNALAGRLARIEETLGSVAALVGEIEGQARGLPDRASLPQVRAVTRAAPPMTHGTTGASGG